LTDLEKRLLRDAAFGENESYLTRAICHGLLILLGIECAHYWVFDSDESDIEHCTVCDEERDSTDRWIDAEMKNRGLR